MTKTILLRPSNRISKKFSIAISRDCDDDNPGIRDCNA